jgi:adenylate cyclase
MARRVEGSELVRRVEWRLWRNIVAANLVGVFLIGFDAVAFAQMIPPGQNFGRAAGMMLLACIPYFLLASLIARPYFSKRLAPATAWIVERRAPKVAERSAMAKLPKQIAVYSLVNWATLELWTIPYLYFVAGFRPGALAYTKMAIAFAFASIISATVTYMVVERTLRPLVALAPTPELNEQPKTVGMFARLVGAYVIASGLPLAAIAITLFGLTPQQREASTPAIIMICLTAIPSGIGVAMLAAHSFTAPLKKVQDRLRAVAQGKLDEIPVDEAGELGQLQIGFNHMVAGLRDRERMREIFGRHVGDEVAKMALSGNASLGGESREATAMFVDMIGSTQMAQTLPAAEVVNVLNAFFDTVVDVVSAHGGFVNKFEGDGALCVFGATREQADHAKRALRAARELQHELMLPPAIEAAIGVSSGEVVAGNVGSMDRYEFTVIGDPVNEASRLTEQAKEFSARLLVSKTTIDRAGDEAAHWMSAGTIPLRGRSEATLAYEPVAPRPLRSSIVT